MGRIDNVTVSRGHYGLNGRPKVGQEKNLGSGGSATLQLDRDQLVSGKDSVELIGYQQVSQTPHTIPAKRSARAVGSPPSEGKKKLLLTGAIAGFVAGPLFAVAGSSFSSVMPLMTAMFAVSTAVGVASFAGLVLNSGK